MRAREADPLDPLDGVAGAEELAELGLELRGEIAAPRVDVLAEQRDLADAFVGEPRDLGDDLAGPAALLSASYRRDDAVGADGVAAHRDLHPRLERPLAVHRQRRRECPLVEPEAAAGYPLPARAEPVGEMSDRAGPERDVDLRVELEDPLALRLGVAAADRDHAAGVAALARDRLAQVGTRASCRASRGSCRC